MPIRHVPILKARKGEFDALSNTRSDVADRLLPLFEVGRVTETMLATKRLSASRTPIADTLDRVADGIVKVWGTKPAMVDAYLWAPEATTEFGEHIIAHLIRKIESGGLPIVPVVGYDRWKDATYQTGVKDFCFAASQTWCLRLDSHAVEDAAEAGFFQENVAEIIDTLNLPASRCLILIDFGDVSATPLGDLMIGAARIINHLQAFGFRDFVTAGCSIPNSINLAVKEPDSVTMILRREMLLWKALRQEFKNLPILYGDYGVRGPTTNDDIRNKYINGKIRYTVDQRTFVVRGHPLTVDGSAVQMHGLASKVVSSPHYLGAGFSWGDERVNACRLQHFMGNSTQWISIDTNHHLAYATQEVEEFERSTLFVVQDVSV